MADPATTGGASSHLQSQLAAGSGGGETHTNPFLHVMTFSNINGLNFIKAASHFAEKLGLKAAAGWAKSALGLESMVGGSKLDKSPMGKPFSKKAKKMAAFGGNPFGGSPSIAPPSIGTPQGTGGKGMH